MDNIFLVGYMKGDLVLDIDGSVGVKVRVGLIGVMIEGYGFLAELLVRVGRAEDANLAYDTGNR